MNLTKSDWYLILLALVTLTMIAINEYSGYGLIGYAVLTPLAFWLLRKALEAANLR